MITAGTPKESEIKPSHQLDGRAAVAFTACRYVTYAIAFLRSILSARYLGPELLGILGFVLLINQYLGYAGCGLQFAVNVDLAVSPIETHRKISSVAITMTGLIGLAIAVVGVCISLFRVNLFPKYLFFQYAGLVGMIAAFGIVQQVFTNIYRIYSRLTEIAVVEVFSAVLLLGLTLKFRGEALITAVLAGLVVSSAFALIVFVWRAPFRISWSLDNTYIHSLFKLGFPLLVYNVSFYLITMVAQSIVSVFYPVQAMGYYTLASSISNAALLGFNSIAWIVYPLVLAKTHEDMPNEEAGRVTDRVNVVLGTGVFLMVLGVLLTLPILFAILPKYSPARGAVTLLLLSQAFLLSSFGYNCLAIARRKQMAIAAVSIAAVVIVAGLALTAAATGMKFIWVAVAVFAGSVLFSLFQARIGSKLLGGIALRPIIPAGSIVGAALCIGGLTINRPLEGAVAGTAAYLLMNRDRIAEVMRLCFPYFQALSRRTSRQPIAANL